MGRLASARFRQKKPTHVRLELKLQMGIFIKTYINPNESSSDAFYEHEG